MSVFLARPGRSTFPLFAIACALAACAPRPLPPPPDADLAALAPRAREFAPLGIETRSFDALTRDLGRDLLAIPALAAAPPTRILVDPAAIRLPAASAIHPGRFADLLKIDLNRVANGRLFFQKPANPFPADYRLDARILPADTLRDRFRDRPPRRRAVFSLLRRQDRTILWTGAYDLQEAAPTPPIPGIP